MPVLVFLTALPANLKLPPPPRSRGSRMSRSASPNTLMPNTTTPRATPGQSAIQGAIHMAQLEDLVESQPAGLDAMVGERGIRLSGGQRQRIGIARALYLDPDILILDEATSSLDGATEQEISKAIDSVSREKTLIVIAHRMNTVRKCDRLLFLKDGRLSAMGTYEELMRDNADFRNMVAVTEEGGGEP